MKSNIEWTESTWNPISGCSRKSDGCSNCYAEAMTKRLAAMGQEKYQGLLNEHNRFNGVVKFDESALLKPLSVKKPTKYFVNSMSDLFHENVEDSWIDKVFAVMALCSHHTFQILTKRPERMKEYVKEIYSNEDRLFEIGSLAAELANSPCADYIIDEPLPYKNIWLGVSVENQRTADERIPLLLETPAAIRFLSCEPLLEQVDISFALPCKFCKGRGWYLERLTDNHKTACVNCINNARKCGKLIFSGQMAVQGKMIDWTIVGGESGSHARPCNIDLIRSLVNQCKSSNTACFVKQLGSVPMMPETEWCDGKSLRLLNANNHKKVPADFVPILMSDRKGGKLEEFPSDLRIRQFPTTT